MTFDFLLSPDTRISYRKRHIKALAKHAKHIVCRYIQIAP
jgi:hypothetical protein